jgi:integrase
MLEILDRQKERMVEGSLKIFPLTKMTLRRRWEAARKNAGLEDVTIHDLRRTHSTYAAAAGVDLRTLADRIGHTDLTMLQKHYAAIVGSAASEAADTIQGIFDGMIVEKNQNAA